MLRWLASALVLLLAPSLVQGERNLPVVCIATSPPVDGQPIKTCPYASQKFLQASTERYVRHCITPTDDGASGACPAADLKWKKFGDLKLDSLDDWVEVCTSEKENGANVSGGDCKTSASAATWSGMKLVNPALVNDVATLPDGAAFTATPSSGASPLTSVLEWNIPGLQGTEPCMASGDWAGPKAAASRETLAGIVKPSRFTLTCASKETLAAQVRWSKPTTNTDGSPLLNLSGYTLSYGNTMVDGQPALTNAQTMPGSATTFILQDYKLTPGKSWFTMVAHTPTSKSDPSNLLTIDFKPSAETPKTYAGHVDVSVDTKPNAPTELTGEQIKAPPPPITETPTTPAQ